MPGQILPSPAANPSAILRPPRVAHVLRRAFPFKLKYSAFALTPRPLLSLSDDLSVPIGGGGSRDRRRGELRARSSGDIGKSLVHDELDRSGLIDGVRERLRIGRDGSMDSAPSTRNRPSSKRTRENGFDGSAVLSGRRKSQSSAGTAERRAMSKGIPVLEAFVDEEKMISMNDDKLITASSLDQLGGQISKATAGSIEAENESYLSHTRFDQCSISPLSLKGLQAAGYDRMTMVQEATLPIILKGKDVLAKAKTGTGKTVAFLLPAVEIISKIPRVNLDQRKPPINVLVICPTRELACQAASEATKLLKYYPSIGVQVVIGGTRLPQEQKRMQANPCQILVATPGRLIDHIENTPGFATRLMGVKILVLDEADRLLEMGFRKPIEKIVAAVPKQRQTLLFSATVPDEVRQICHIAMKRDHEFISTVEEGSEETHSQVSQMHLIAPLDKQFALLYSTLLEHIAEDVEYKVIVFCTTAMVTKLVADLLTELQLNVREIHSRKSQSHRTKVSEDFKKSRGLILVSSDVSARGVDYPDVTLVIQIGVPSSREQYIHRLGRTGRKGKEGKGLLMLAPWEKYFLSSIKDLPATEAPLMPIDPKAIKQVEQALVSVDMKSKESAYQAWLGYYNSNRIIGRDKANLVSLANEFSRSMGLETPPAITKLVLRKMGLSNVPGLRTK